MLHWTYVGIAAFVAAVCTEQLLRAKSWRDQAALALVLIPLVLRILHVK